MYDTDIYIYICTYDTDIYIYTYTYSDIPIINNNNKDKKLCKELIIYCILCIFLPSIDLSACLLIFSYQVYSLTQSNMDGIPTFFPSSEYSG